MKRSSPSPKSQIRHGRTVMWVVETGFLRGDGEYRDDRPLRVTTWDYDGRVWMQQIASPDGREASAWRVEMRLSPPWLWGVTDQTEPSMPAWMKDDKLWAKALEEAR